MAYAALVSLAQTIDLILNYHQHSISPQFKNQIITIHNHVSFLKAFLEDFPDKASSVEVIIRKVTHIAEDIIELFMSKHVYESRYASLAQFQQTQKGKYDFPDLANNLGSIPIWEWDSKERRITTIFFTGEYYYVPGFASLESSVGPSKSPKGQYERLRYNLDELKEATEEIASVAEIVKRIKNSTIVKDVQLGDDSTVGSSSRVAPVHKHTMVSFENDVMEIKSRLCGESSKLEIIPIVGMGGIGKTTLTQNVFDDMLIKEHFPIRAWATVSKDYSVQEIVSCLLISMKVPDSKNEAMEEYHVYQHLKGRRYLIVLDDLWSKEAWNGVKMMFPDDGNGSRIMLTTRLLDVASHADSSSPVHEMHLMDQDRSWDLLRQRVFKQDPCPVELEHVGKMIARNCSGLPLAIVVISGILLLDQTEAAWWIVADNVKSAISANDEQFDKILRLSYTNLPHRLRPCFLYMGGFPEDYEVRASKLVKVWAAEGFVKPNVCNKSFEETAEEYLEDLFKRNLVFVTKRKSDGRIKSFSIHDLMREMCIRIAQEDKFFLHGRVSLREGMNILRRVSITHSDPDLHKNIYGLTIRSILYFGRRREPIIFFVQNFRLLRVLDLLGAYGTRFLPAVVFELVHLRYLALHGLFIIPEAISNLQNLQTLIISLDSFYEHLSYCASKCIPTILLEIWSMPQLRHLDIRFGFCFGLPPLQQGATFCLENLQTLSLAVNFISTPEILKAIPNLKKLGISYSAKRNHEKDYQLHNLIYLEQLENLKLKIHEGFPSREKVNPAFPKTLKKLTLIGWKHPWKDMKIVGLLPNLEVLKLRDHACVGDEWETTEGEFSHLKFLLIDESELQGWITESSHFPRLKRLVLRRCQYLEEIPETIGEVSTLELIEVDDEFLFNSAKQIQDDQLSYGNDVFQVRLMESSYRCS